MGRAEKKFDEYDDSEIDRQGRLRYFLELEKRRSMPAFPKGFDELSAKQQKDIELIEKKLDEYDNDDRNLIVHIFSATTSELVAAIKNKTLVGKVDLAAEVCNPNFRFMAKTDPELSSEISEAIAATALLIRNQFTGKAAGESTKKRIENADIYATEMYMLIENMRQEAGVKTYRATVELLNREGVKTYNGGNWHLQTLRNLQKRWEKLGLFSDMLKSSKGPKPE